MRTDVKLGVVLSAVIVCVAGAYFLFRGPQEQPIPVSSSPGALTDAAKSPSSAQPTDRPRLDRSAASRPRSQPAGTPGTRQPSRVGTDRPRVTTTQPSRPTDRSAGAASPERQSPAESAALAGRSGNRTAKPRDGKVTTPANGAASDSAAGSAPGVPFGSTTPAGQTSPPQADGASASGAVPQRRGSVPLAGTRPDESKALSTGTPAADVAVDFHRVQPGDTLSSLSQRYYGSTAYVKVLSESNPQLAGADHLRVGQVIKIPPRPAERPASGHTAAPPARPSLDRPASDQTARTYKVKEGDSFYKIARDVLGDAARWQELFELNKELVDGDPKRLRIGQEIRLPGP